MTIKEINELIEEGQSLKQIAQAYFEIANLKIKKIRSQVERNRKFFEEVFYVYGLVKNVATRKRLVFPKAKNRVSLIITSNYRFYGNINYSLIDFFISSISNLSTDIIILGKSAIDFFRTNNIFLNYQEVVLKDDQPQGLELNHLISLIKDYQQVVVFYSKIKSLLIQEPTMTDITASSQLTQDLSQIDFNVLFEPELPKILSFFDSQILTLLLEQTFLESELARTASRFISMDQAEIEANKSIREYERLKSYILKTLSSNKLLEAIAAIKKARYVQ